MTTLGDTRRKHGQVGNNGQPTTVSHPHRSPVLGEPATTMQLPARFCIPSGEPDKRLLEVLLLLFE